MLIAIISDVHDNIPNLKKVLDYCAQNSVEKIICCGDLASLETLDFLNDNFPGEIFFVFGNMDNDYLKNKFFECHSERDKVESRNLTERSLDKLEMTSYKNTKIFKDFGEAKFSKAKPSGEGLAFYNAAFVHFPDVAKELCASGKYDFVFHGHTHKPWTEIINNCTLLNPGNVANQIYPPTFAIWNVSQNNFNLIRINEIS